MYCIIKWSEFQRTAAAIKTIMAPICFIHSRIKHISEHDNRNWLGDIHEQLRSEYKCAGYL